MHESASHPRGEIPRGLASRRDHGSHAPPCGPFNTLARLDQDLDALVRPTWGGALGSPRNAAPGGPDAQSAGRTAGYVPAIEMRTDRANVVITLELTGVDVGDVDIENAES